MNVPPSGMKEKTFVRGKPGETMPVPTGRFEKRIAMAVTVDIRLEGEEMPKEVKTRTENVSPRGARVLMDREWRPGQRVLVAFLEEGIQSQAQIVYCQRLQGTKFAVGLELSSPLAL
jgi:hypothetical protein